MFKIGDFSKLSRVSVKTLRYYDEIGLLKPAYVDNFTSYRYYSAEQLPRLNRILALKDLGFSLEQTERLLDDALSPAQMREILRMKQAEIQRRVQDETERLARVEARLRAIEQEQTMPAYDIIVKRVEPQLVASVRDHLPSYPAIGTFYDEIGRYVASQGAHPAGPYIAVWHDEEYRDDQIDAEAAIPIDKALPGAGRVAVRELPGYDAAACVVHHGDYSTIGQAYSALLAWIGNNGYRIAGPACEIYLSASQPTQQDDSGIITEIRFPVEREDRLEPARVALTPDQLGRLTERSRQTIQFAADEARGAGQSQIGIVHLLIGMLRASRSFAARALADLGVLVDQARLELGNSAPIDAVGPPAPHLGEQARQALTFAADEAARRGHDYIGTEHLLLGLLQAEDAAAVLKRAGVSLERAREKIEEQFQ
jgi:DNA-binding transcriptional MerR regulator